MVSGLVAHVIVEGDEDGYKARFDEARGIILENKLKKYIKRLPVKPPVPFSWKHVQWGLGSLKIDIGVFKDAVRQENAVQGLQRGGQNHGHSGHA